MLIRIILTTICASGVFSAENERKKRKKKSLRIIFTILHNKWPLAEKRVKDLWLIVVKCQKPEVKESVTFILCECMMFCERKNKNGRKIGNPSKQHLWNRSSAAFLTTGFHERRIRASITRIINSLTGDLPGS